MSPDQPVSQPRTLVFLAYPQMGLLDLTGAQTVFWAATKAMAERGLPGYFVHTASLAGGLMPTAEGLSVDTVPLATFDPATLDTLIAPHGLGVQRHLPARPGRLAPRPTRRHALGDVRHAQARVPEH